jgi:putative FmdB family regulatory protein
VPTYEYACTACGRGLEAVQSFSDDPLTVCPECGGALRKVYGAVGIVLKGSGFYKTDARAAAGNGSKKKSEAGDSSGTSSSSESKGSDGGSKTEGSGSKTEGSGSGTNGSGTDAKPAAAAAT